MNRSSFCAVWKGLFTYIELQMLSEGNHPLSLAPHRKELEDQFLAQIAAGQRGSVVMRPTATTLTMERANDPRRCLPVSQMALSLRNE